VTTSANSNAAASPLLKNRVPPLTPTPPSPPGGKVRP
jgi:hypothetical protein